MSAREEFIEIFKEKIHRDGAAALLDYLENKRGRRKTSLMR